ncbi:OmpA family protein [Sanyastnella coralliicola]|uniref:OmpA family protein n=1 Tax=Sanyastnella coralliicola TaxID=3069118 RepID=UPI0027B9C395|nr:OmpA family protein [Longitalea sp. SCSIO 12813]
MQKTNTKHAVQRYSLLLLFALFCSVAFGQKNYTEDADLAFENKAYHEAAADYLRVYGKLSGVAEKGEVNYKIGECYRLMLDHKGAEDYYKKAIGFRFDETDPIVHYNYGEVLRAQNKFDDAIQKYNDYMEKGGDKTKARAAIEMCEKAALEMDEPSSRYVVDQMPILNSEQFDYGPAWSGKRYDEIIFGSARPSSAGSSDDPITGESYMDLFISERDKKGKWSTPVPVNNTINTQHNEGAACFDKKFSTMYFTRCIDEKDARFACDIYYARRQGKDFGPAEPMNLIDRELNDSSQVGQPALSPDDMYMVFVSDMPGGFGGRDLWYVEYDKKAKTWGKPKNMGDKVNTKGDEMFPSFKLDGTLYFASDMHGSMGGLDIFKATRAGEDMTIAEVEGMPAPINSSSDDFGIIWEKDLDQGMFTSSRPNGKGKDDIYEFKMPPLEFAYIANVYNYDTGVPLANSKVTVQGTDGQSYNLTTDGNGGISLDNGEIIASTNYAVDVALDGYIGTSDQFSTEGLAESTTFAREYFLKEIVIGIEYDLPLVQYPFNEATLLVNEEVNSADSLNFLYDLLVTNGNFVIQLEAHTDTRGKVGYNQELSQRRAQTCVDYLVSKGIAKDRMVAVGKGKSEPKISDKEINAMATEEEKEAAHQVNRRTIFKILRYDYVPKEE